MALENNDHFRLTLWPGVPLPLPPFARRASYRLDQSGSALIGSGEPVEVKQRHGEIYLRAYHLDLADPKAILAFTRAHGPLRTVLLWEQLLAVEQPQHKYTQPEEQERVESVVAGDAEARRLLDPSEPDYDPLEITPLASFVHTARFLRDLTTAWRVLSHDPTLPTERARWELRKDDTPSYTAALAVLLSGLGSILARIHPYITQEYEAYDEDDPPPYADGTWQPTEPPDFEQAHSHRFALLSEICALELHNHIAGQAIYRTCQNERCGGSFVVQIGRAEHGLSHRQGVLYCTPACAQAQAQRMYRRRKKTRKERS